MVLDEIEGCKGTPYDISFDQIVPGGNSAAQVVSEFEGVYTSQLIWPPGSGPVEHDLPTDPGAIELSFDFSQTPDELRWIESLTCDGMTSCHYNCMTRIEIPAVLRIKSEDGTLNEEFSVLVAATERGINVVHTIALGDLQGSIKEDSITLDPSWTLLQYQIQTEVEHGREVRGRFLLAVVDPTNILWFNAVGVWPVP